MIPASYLYKDAFRQAFYDPDIDQAMERHRRGHPGRRIFSWLRGRPLETAARPAGEEFCRRPPTGA